MNGKYVRRAVYLETAIIQNKGNGNSKNQNNNNNKKPVNQGNGNNAKKPEVQNSNNNAKEPVKENGNSNEKKTNKEDGNAKEKKTNNRDGKAKGNKAESSNNEKKKDNEDGNTKENKAEGNSKKDKKKPISLVEELKQKQEKTGEKRKREEEEGEDGGKKIKAESTSSWQETELPGEDDKVILLAIKVALESSKVRVKQMKAVPRDSLNSYFPNQGALTLKEARKKAIKLIQSHPKAKTTNKKELKDKFEDVLTLQLANDTITVKTVQ